MVEYVVSYDILVSKLAAAVGVGWHRHSRWWEGIPNKTKSDKRERADARLQDAQVHLGLGMDGEKKPPFANEDTPAFKSAN
jgi:hypothetical protein